MKGKVSLVNGYKQSSKQQRRRERRREPRVCNSAISARVAVESQSGTSTASEDFSPDALFTASTIHLTYKMVSISRKEARKAAKGKTQAVTSLPKPKTKSILKSKADEVEEDEEWESDEDEDEEDDDEENGGVSEEGMKRLMQLVSEEDLDDFERAQLADEDDEDDEEDEDDDEEDEEVGEMSGEGSDEDDDEDEDEEMNGVSCADTSRTT